MTERRKTEDRRAGAPTRADILRADISEARADGAEARADVAEDNVSALRREVAELKMGTSGLAEQVGTLSLALQTVGHLQTRQAAIEKKADNASEVAASVAKAVVPRSEIIARERASRERLLGRVYLIGGSMFVVGLLLTLVGVNYLAGRNAALYEVCLQRNIQNSKVDTYLESQTRKVNANPALTDQQRKDNEASLAALTDAFPVVSCEGLK